MQVTRPSHRLASALCRRNTQRCGRVTFTTSLQVQDEDSRLPRIARPSLWKSLVPRSLRKGAEEHDDFAVPVSKHIYASEKREGMTIAALGLLVGSFAINIIALRRETVNYTRETETKLALLREVVQRVRNGEEVDVKKLLGTGDPEKEAEWEAVIQDLENYNHDREKKENEKSQSVQGQTGGFGIGEIKFSPFSWFKRTSEPAQETERAVEEEALPSKQPERQPAFLM